MDGDTIKLVVAVLGFAGGIVALIAALVGRRKEIVNRQEVIHRHHGMPTKGDSDSSLICPHCHGREFRRILVMRGLLNWVIVVALPVWWIGFVFVVLIYVVLPDERSSVKNAEGLCCSVPLVTVALSFPGYCYWHWAKRPMLVCQDCGARVLARDARV